NSAMNRVEKFLLACHGHGWVLVRAFLGKVAGRKKKQARKLVEVCGVKNSSVLGTLHLEAVLLAQVRDGVFQNAWLAVDPFYNLMLEAGRLGEHEQRFLRGRHETRRQACGGSSQCGGFQKRAAIFAKFHFNSLACLGMTFRVLAAWIRGENSLGCPAQF